MRARVRTCVRALKTIFFSLTQNRVKVISWNLNCHDQGGHKSWYPDILDIVLILKRWSWCHDIVLIFCKIWPKSWYFCVSVVKYMQMYLPFKYISSHLRPAYFKIFSNHGGFSKIWVILTNFSWVGCMHILCLSISQLYLAHTFFHTHAKCP